MWTTDDSSTRTCPLAVEDIFVDLKVNSPGGSDMDKMVVDLKRFALKMAGQPGGGAHVPDHARSATRTWMRS